MNQPGSRPSGQAIANVDRKPLLTVLMVTHNQESFVREGLCGVMEQTIADQTEVIVVDRGSEQSEWAVVADLQRRYPNLVSLRVPAATATGAALNLALKIASGRYLTVLGPADRLRNDAYQLLACALDAEPDAMLAYGDTFFTAVPHGTFGNHTSCGKTVWPEYTAQQLSQLPQHSLVAPHPMWRRVLNDSIGGFDERGGAEVMRQFLIRAAERFRMLHVEEFTGLSLVAAGTGLNPGGTEQPAIAPTPQPAEVSPVRAAAPQFGLAQNGAVASAVERELDAEDAYDHLQTALEGATDEQAAAELKAHLVRHPDHARAHNDLAAYNYRLGDREAALRHYRSAVELDPREAIFRKNLADLCFVEGELDEAIAIYLALFQDNPRDVETLLNLGIISESVGQTAEAESFYQRALELEPWNAEVRRRITEMRARLAGCETQAGTEAQEPDDEASAEELYEQAQELVASEDFDGAFAKLKGIIRVFPDFAPAYNDLAVLHYQNGDKEEALSHYEEAARLAPGNSTFRKNLADFNFVEGSDVDGAIGIYLDLLQKEPCNVDTLVNLGRICTALNRPEEARSFYGKVTQLEPWNREARESLNSLRSCANA